MELQLIPESTIRGVSWDYHIQGHYCLDYEDLVAEGYALAVKLIKELEKNDFKLMFRKSLKNHFLNMIRGAFTSKRKTILVDLSEALELVDRERIEELWLEQKLKALRRTLSPDARKLLAELICPGQRTIDLAVKRHRSQNVKFQEKRNRLKRSWRITDQVIQKSLGFSYNQFVLCEFEIRKAIWQL